MQEFVAEALVRGAVWSPKNETACPAEAFLLTNRVDGDRTRQEDKKAVGWSDSIVGTTANQVMVRAA